MNNLKQMKQELEETKNKCTEIEKKIEELEKQESKVRWRGKQCEKYWYISSCGTVSYTMEMNDDQDNRSYEMGNYFRTEEEAEKVAEKIKIYMQLKDLALRLNKGEKIDWENNNHVKWYICYKKGTVLDLDDMYTCNLQDLGQIYCLDKNFLEIAKQEISEENLRKLFE